MLFSFQLNLKASVTLSNDQSCIDLRVEFPQLYPRENPIVTLLNSEDLFSVQAKVILFYQQYKQLNQFINNYVPSTDFNFLSLIIEIQDLLFQFDLQNAQQNPNLKTVDSSIVEDDSPSLIPKSSNEYQDAAQYLIIPSEENNESQSTPPEGNNIYRFQKLMCAQHPIQQKCLTVNQAVTDSESEEQQQDGSSGMGSEAALLEINFSRFRQDFEDIKQIGSGGFGKVFKAKNRLDGNYYALKQIMLDYSDSGLCQRTKNEAILLSRLHHQHIVRYYQAWTEDIQPRKKTSIIESLNQSDDDDESFHMPSNLVLDYDSESAKGESENSRTNKVQISQDDDFNIEWVEKIEQVPTKNQYLYIQMEYCSGETLKNRMESKTMTSDMKRNIIRQILEALSYLHQKRYMHRDLKPQNIFLDEAMNVKLGDFGLATEMKKEISYIEHKMISKAVSIEESQLTQGIGTFMYLAPEQQNTQRYDMKADMFSLGIIMFEMYYEFRTDMERSQVLGRLKEENGPLFPEDFTRRIGIDNLDIYAKVRSLVQRDPKDRPDSTDFLKEYSDKQMKEIIQSLANPKNSEFKTMLQIIFDIKPNYESKQFRSPQDEIIQIMDDVMGVDGKQKIIIREYLKAQLMMESAIEKIFILYAGIRYDCSAFMLIDNNIRMQKLDKNVLVFQNPNQLSPVFLSQQGLFFQYSDNLLAPFISTLNELPQITKFRRYTFGDTCIQWQQFNQDSNPNNSQPHKRKVAQFDIVWASDNSPDYYVYHVAELAVLASQVAPLILDSQFKIRISHTFFLQCIIIELELSEEFLVQCLKNQEFQKILRSISLNKVDKIYEGINILQDNLNLTKQKAEKLLRLLTIQATTYAEFAQLINYQFTRSQIHQPLDQLKMMEELMQGNQTNMALEFRTFIISDLKRYFTGVCFEVIELSLSNKMSENKITQSSNDLTYQKQRRQAEQPSPLNDGSDSINQFFMIGGAYSQNFSNNNTNKQACGIQIATEALIIKKFKRFIYLKKKKNDLVFCPLNQVILQSLRETSDVFELDTLVSSEGGDALLDEKFRLVCQLRRNYLSANFTSYAHFDLKQQHQGFNIRSEVYLKKRTAAQMRVRVRMPNENIRKEVELGHLVDTLKFGLQ